MAQKFEEYKVKMHKHLTDKDKPWTPIFDIIESKTGVDRFYAFLGKEIFFSVQQLLFFCV